LRVNGTRKMLLASIWSRSVFVFLMSLVQDPPDEIRMAINRIELNCSAVIS
jgi:hypothetical protein